MRLDELGHTDEDLAGSNADPLGTDLLSYNAPIPAALAMTFDAETSSLIPPSSAGLYPAGPFTPAKMTVFRGLHSTTRAADTHARTLMASRARKSSINASREMNYAALTEGDHCDTLIQ